MHTASIHPNKKKDFFSHSPCCFSQDSKRRRGGRETQREKEQGKVPPGNKLEIMDLFDIRPQSGQPIQRGTRPNCN